ncbi:MAG: SurA N-terminal domain-containing protein [Bacteroidales bacterium]|nr:SurA N-terminal domain-containing protein [Candidatus Physcousia equi]
MATLQKIRSNKITQIAIGLGMLAFIAGSAVEIMKSSAPDTEVASLNGKSLDYAELNQMADDYKDVLQTMGQLPQGEQVSNEVMAQIREQVYQRFLQQQMLEEECEKLGLTVTDTELQNIIKSSQHPLLAQTPFRNQQGQFDYTLLQQFIQEREQMMSNPQVTAEQREYMDRMYRFWCFIEKEIRSNTLMEKYQVLLSSLVMSNPISAKSAFDARVNESDIVMAAIPFTSIDDATVKVEDADIKAKYEEYKEAFYQPNESRDIKYIDVVVKASSEDEAALREEMAGYAASLSKPDAVIESVVRQSQSLVNYSSAPVSKNTLPRDVAAQIDSMAVGTQTDIYFNALDNTLNVVRLIGKVSRPDSVEVRQIAALNQDAAAATKTADSIVNALQAGADFDTIAKAYNQPATKQWITSNMFEGQTLDESNKKFIETATTASVGTYNKISFEGGVIVLQVTDRRQMSDKYDVAVIKRTIDFSNETANKYFNDLSSFVATNKTLEAMQKDQKTYVLLDRNDLDAMTNDIVGVMDSREVVKWAFKEESKVGDVSEIMYCGKNREHLVVAVLTAIHPAGYRDANDEQIKPILTQLATQDKKATQLQDKMKAAKSVADVAKMAGAVSDTIQHITFAAPTFVSKMAASEPVLSAAVSAAQQGKFVSAVRGNAGVYAFQVIAKNKTEEQYDEKAEMQRSAQQQMYMMSRMFQTDMRDPASIFYTAFKNAKKSDKRHLFY